MLCVRPRGGLRPPRSDLEQVAARVSLGRRTMMMPIKGMKGFRERPEKEMKDDSILSLFQSMEICEHYFHQILRLSTRIVNFLTVYDFQRSTYKVSVSNILLCMLEAFGHSRILSDWVIGKKPPTVR